MVKAVVKLKSGVKKTYNFKTVAEANKFKKFIGKEGKTTITQQRKSPTKKKNNMFNFKF